MSDLSDSLAQSWRLIPYWDGPGHIQMTMDDWLLRQFVQGLGKPTLRFYGWQPAAISLGYFQKSYPEHWPTLTWEDQLLSIVRRPSGGRAVLHGADVGIVGGRADGLAATVKDVVHHES